MTTRATSLIRRQAVKAERVVDTITLDHGERHRRRVALTADGGLDFLLDLDSAQVLEEGDALRLEDGRLVQVKAAAERLLAIKAGNPLRLMKVAWHIGNRHIPAELTLEAVYIADDHVLAEMARGLGATVDVVQRPFKPERGAYDGHGGDGSHGGHHGHHDHDHSHDRGHGHHDHSRG